MARYRAMEMTSLAAPSGSDVGAGGIIHGPQECNVTTGVDRGASGGYRIRRDPHWLTRLEEP